MTRTTTPGDYDDNFDGNEHKGLKAGVDDSVKRCGNREVWLMQRCRQPPKDLGKLAAALNRAKGRLYVWRDGLGGEGGRKGDN
ncbi:hypothetical protein LIA77_01710 [Sarocladium implicatum]|nr:hypothetical protein LIA77_01710 [Sarocladium implicatum]